MFIHLHQFSMTYAANSSSIQTLLSASGFHGISLASGESRGLSPPVGNFTLP